MLSMLIMAKRLHPEVRAKGLSQGSSPGLSCDSCCNCGTDNGGDTPRNMDTPPSTPDLVSARCYKQGQSRTQCVETNHATLLHTAQQHVSCPRHGQKRGSMATRTSLKPLFRVYDVLANPFGAVTRASSRADGSSATETLVAVGGRELLPLLGCDGREGLDTGTPTSLSWGDVIDSIDEDDEESRDQLLSLFGPCWDPFTRSVFALTESGHAVVRLHSDNRVEVVAGRLEESGSLDGRGTAARFESPRCITSDGQGALYVVDEWRISKLLLPPQWCADGTVNFSALCYMVEAACADLSMNMSRLIERQFGAVAEQQAQRQQPQPPQPPQQQLGPQPAPTANLCHDGGNGAAADGGAGDGDQPPTVLVRTLPCGPTVGPYCMGAAYDPATHSLLLCTSTAVYRRPLAPGAAEEPLLLAGREGFHGSDDGAGRTARFQVCSGLAVDGAGCALVADSDHPLDSTAVRHVAPDGSVTTLATGLAGRNVLPVILPNGYLLLSRLRTQSFVVLDLGLKPNACDAAAPPRVDSAGQGAGAGVSGQQHTLSSDLGALLDRQPDGTADVVLEVGGRVFHAHRGVLAARSEYFCQRLDPGAGFRDGDKHGVELPDADADAFAVVLRYMYTDGVGRVKEELLQGVGELADRLLLPGLCAEVGSQMLGSVGVDSVVELLLWAEQRSASFPPLLCGLKAWFVEHREEVGETCPASIKQLWARSPDLAFELHYGPGSRKRGT